MQVSPVNPGSHEQIPVEEQFDKLDPIDEHPQPKGKRSKLRIRKIFVWEKRIFEITNRKRKNDQT